VHKINSTLELIKLRLRKVKWHTTKSQAPAHRHLQAAGHTQPCSPWALGSTSRPQLYSSSQVEQRQKNWNHRTEEPLATPLGHCCSLHPFCSKCLAYLTPTSVAGSEARKGVGSGPSSLSLVLLWSTFFFIHLFICAYIVWAISPPCPLPPPFPSYPSLFQAEPVLPFSESDFFLMSISLMDI
jgi:hypothetical protein